MYDEEYMDVVEQGPEGAENFDALEEDLLGVSAPAGGDDDETGVEESGETGCPFRHAVLPDHGSRDRFRRARFGR